MFKQLLTKVFGDRQERDLRRYAPLVSKINEVCREWFGELPLEMEDAFPSANREPYIYYAMGTSTRAPNAEEKEQLDKLLLGKTAEFRQRLAEGETLDDLLPEAFAAVKLTCWRQVGESWQVLDSITEWDMVPYDVQLVGGCVLHEGRIAEMATGEGKTLVALMPVYLNALAGLGVHVITVNDFLAKRDSQWMGRIFEYLGLTVGCLDNTEPSTPERREQYEADITYGTNNEFGFDYLRDNMAVAEEQLAQHVPPHYLGEWLKELAAFVEEQEGETLGLMGEAFTMRLPASALDEFTEKLTPRFGVKEFALFAHPKMLERLKAKYDPEHGGCFAELSESELLLEEQVQVEARIFTHSHNYSIIDEVDNILIDEARTPLIISGPVDRSTHRFEKMKPLVSNLVRKQLQLVNRLAGEAREQVGDEESAEESYEGAAKLFQCQLGAPKHKMLSKLKQDPSLQRQVQKVELDYIAWKKNARMAERDMSSIEEGLYFVIDEKGHNIDLTELGRRTINPDNPDMVQLLDIVDEVAQIENREELTAEEKDAAKAKIHAESEIRQEELHNIAQLLRAYSLYEKDIEYVVRDNQVKIVDEFTGRILSGRRYSDGLHQALEAKENVKIEIETQTLATITLQNYFRMYGKLAGMTGTAVTEAGEFHHTYKIDVTVIPSNKPTKRDDANDLIFRTRKEKYNAIIDEVERLYQMKLPVLVGTVSVEASETLSRMLRRRKISHNVLNAKQHQHEAEIVRDAGRPGQVTISTNMAGRGTDIKLQPGDLMGDHKVVADIVRTDEDGDQLPFGLQVVGTERHESRRIDLQLRGRSGRQGDSGRSCFYLSLEDELMRLFGSDRMASMMERFGMKLDEGEPLEHPWLTGAVRKAQKKVEQRNFEIRKRTLEYDDVMNKQRKAIYGLRREILTTPDARELTIDLCVNHLSRLLAEYDAGSSRLEEFRADEFFAHVQRRVPYVDFSKIEAPPSVDDLLDLLQEKLTDAYHIKRRILGDSLMLRLAKWIVLQAIDANWKDHLLAVDAMRESIWMQSYAQTEPLVAYQKEAGNFFMEMEDLINKQVFNHLFTTQVAMQNANVQRQEMLAQKGEFDGLPEPEAGGNGEGAKEENKPKKPQTYRRAQAKVGRNDPCTCGSGKKYKKCCGRSNVT